MKKNAGYKINYITNTITISHKFLDEASVLGNAADTMNALRALGMKIELQTKGAQKNGLPRIGYNKMEKYINCVEDSATYLAEFEANKKAAQGTSNAYAAVWKWFKKKFPNYNEVPEFDENLRIVVTPANYDGEEAAA